MDLPVLEKERLSPEQIAKNAMAKLADAKKADAEKIKADKASQVEEKAEPKGAADAGLTAEVKTEEKQPEPVPEKKEEEPKLKAEDKVGKRKEEVQREIDELVSKKKALENEVGDVSQVKRELAELRTKLQQLEKPKQTEDLTVLLKKSEQERITKYLTEDKEKPRDQRREMAKEDLDEWYLEDPTSATEWINERSLRRGEERTQDKQKVVVQGKAEEFLTNQARSRDKLLAKFPQINVESRARELQGQGKSPQEIHQTLMKENQHYRLCHEIATSDSKYLEREDGPELVMYEIERRLTSEGNGKKVYTAEEVERIKSEAIESERKRLEGLDVGVRSTTGAKESSKPLTDFEKRQLEIAKKAGMTEVQLNKVKERRALIMGANIFDESKNG
jgi:hypothetical protein